MDATPQPSPPVAPAWQRPRLSIILPAAILIAVILIVVLVKSFTPQTPPPNGAEKLAANFYTAVAHQQYTTAYGMLAPQQQAELTAYAFTLFMQQQDQQFGTVTAFHEVRYDRDTNQANQGVVQERVTRGTKTHYLVGLTMVQSADGTWKILEENHGL